MNKTSYPAILIIAGGTGGHVMPALSVASVLQAQFWSIHWLGTRKGLEATLVPKYGYPIRFIEIGGLRGKGILTKLLAPFRILHATCQAIRVICDLKPTVVLGMGGFVTGPGCLAAWLCRIPVVIHEQNAVAGLTNRCLAWIARSVCSGFPAVFKERYHPIVTGNPVRETLVTMSDPESRYRMHSGPIRLLIMGGSLGAKVFNETVPMALSTLPSDKRPEVWHQTGKTQCEATITRYRNLGVSGRVEPFIEDMQAAYEWADLILCRAGASTIAELTCVGIASLLIPYPHAVDDHQYANGLFLVEAGAALLWRETQFSPENLLEYLQSLGSRDLLLAMAKAARRLAIPDAALAVARQCIQHRKLL